MDSFVDIHGRPVHRVDLAVGETRIVGLKKFSLQPMVEVGVIARNSDRSVGTFQTMWNNHPMSPTNGAVHYPCNNGGAPLHKGVLHSTCLDLRETALTEQLF